MKKILAKNMFLLITPLILLFVNFLYDKDLRGSFYGLLICLFLYICVTAVSLVRYVRKLKHLKAVGNQLEELIEELPIPDNEQEQVYQQMILQVYQENQKNRQEARNREQDMKEYYSLWIHQIKTPIAALSLLLQGKELEANRYKLQQELFLIEQYATMALHYQNLQSSQNDLLLKEYDISRLIKKVIKKFSTSFIEKKLSLEYEDFSHTMITDEKWFSFLVEQLLSNAVKYTNQGSVRISFRNEPVPTLMIQDTGIGISEEDIPRIFERGYTGYNGHMDQKATGIGLYLCKDVAEKLGITIQVSSKVQEGSCFSLILEQIQEENRE